MTTNDRRPWYREPLVWLVVSFPAAAVLGGIATMILAVRSWDGVVVDDYYKRGLEINRTLIRDERAAALGLRAAVALAPSGREVRVTIAGHAAFVPPPTLRVAFLHGTRAGHDQHVILMQARDGNYTGSLLSLARGNWILHLEAGDWRLTDRLRIR